MQGQSKKFPKNQLKWQSLRSFNIAIMSSIVFFFSVGMIQSYITSALVPIFPMPFFIPLTIVSLSIAVLVGLIKKYDKLVQILSPLTCILVTLFISINSTFQEVTYHNSFLYLVLLLPLFYSYLFSYSTKCLLINNVFMVVCYILSAAFGKTDALVFLFNSTFLLTLCYLTITVQLRNSKIQSATELNENNEESILNHKTSQYLNRIIHDIRQPLSSLSLYSHLLENKLDDSPHQQLGKNIKLSSEELDRWLSSLLDLARLDSHAVTTNINEFSLTSALSPSIKKYQFQAKELGVKVISHLSDISIQSDQRLLTEIIETLLSNAIVHGKQTSGAKVLLSVRRYQGKALLQVWNQGAEISSEMLSILFDELALADTPLHNKSKGIGLGLPIAQRKAKLCSTSINVSTNRNGNCFSLILDLAKNVKKPINLNTLSNHATNYEVLLIDDDQGILNALCMLLGNWGYKVDCANTVESGLEKYYSKNYDLVITDYRFSNKKTGLDIIKTIKETTDIPAVLLTGEADPKKLKEVQMMAKEVNYKILSKPVKPASLRFLLKQLLK